ncbi:MAG: hypothetical protein K6E98_12370 [Lachnospiraceae bacterium]|nr:hypothetical protein [Lachnospiraceae bacterium]
MRKKLFKAFLRIGILFLVFLISVMITSTVINKGNTDMTAEMKKAGLPVVYVNVNGEYINCLHGYVAEMEGSYLRGTITPMSADRKLPIKIKAFDSIITGVAYEVYTLSMERLLESGEIQTFDYLNDEISATVPVKDLIEDEKEYMLVLKLTLSDGRVASYYCRFIDKPELYLTEKLDFVHNFSSKTFDKTAAEELRTYMESNSEGDNSSFGYVNIHSNFNQLTWGNLEPVLESDKELRILDINTKDAAITLDYTVSVQGELYDVWEYFYLTRGSDRIYLIDYERTMDKIINEENVVVANGKIFHGILSDAIDYKENKDANIFCFVQERSLYSYNSDTDSLTRIYSFRDKENNDVRTSYKMHNIKILYVDDVGNVYFAVYGYMNRGNHEGETGITVYYYDTVFNTVEENLFIPYTKSYEILKHDVENLCYVNENNTLYLMFNGTIYSINLSTMKAELLASGLNETRFVSSLDNSMIGWQAANSLYEYNTLTFMSLNSMVPLKIEASRGHILIPLGFFNHDFVYGSVAVMDIMLDSTGRTVLPMDYIYIQNIKGEILKTYHHEGIYVSDVQFKDNMMNLERIIIDKDTELVYPTEDDQIMNNQIKEAHANNFTNVITEETETTWQTVLKNTEAGKNTRNLTTKEVLYEGNRNFYLNVQDVLDRYYVYSKGEITAIYTDAADAVYTAEKEAGIVVDKKSSYIWKGNDLKSKTMIEDIEFIPITGNSVAACLDKMLNTAGVYVDVKSLLEEGKTPLDIMKENIEDKVVLPLAGCSTEAMKYYIGMGCPVMAMVENDEAVLIIGYDDKNLIIYDPYKEKSNKIGIDDGKVWLASNGNRFLTYTK